MRILMVAPPGAGKGTQAVRLAEHFDIEHLASGEMLRQELDAGTPLGEQVRTYVESGDLVPDDLVLRLVLDRVLAAAKRGGYGLDGFPRTLAQATASYEEAGSRRDVSLQAVVHLRVEREELRRRLLGRARKEGRHDDTPEVIEHRLAVYDRQTEPLIELYRDRGILVSVDGGGSADEVTAQLLEALVGFGAART